MRYKTKRNILAGVFSFFITIVAIANPPTNFNEAKEIASHIFSTNPITLYCGCHYNPLTNQVNLQSCGMQSAAVIPRANYLEWEHMMPAENFGKHLYCWRETICKSRGGKHYRGRKCCDKISAIFRRMEAELYNLWPAVGLINGARSNYRYSELPNADFNDHTFYGCPIFIDKSLKKVEPRDEAKGIVARANLFMVQKYHIKLSVSQKRLFETWNKKYPPTAWEKTWAYQVASVEGYTNPFIAQDGESMLGGRTAAQRSFSNSVLIH